MAWKSSDLPPHYQQQVAEKLAQEDRVRAARAGGFARPEALTPKRRVEIANGAAVARWSGKPKRKNKYGNVRTKFKSVQGFTVTADSKLEAAMFAWLDQEMVAGRIRWWIPHPRFPLPGKVVYEADALAIRRDGSLETINPVVYDAKGHDTQSSIDKRKQVLDLYGIEVEIVRGKARFGAPNP